MESPNFVDLPVTVGQDISVVFYAGSETHVISGTISSVAPFLIISESPDAGRLARQRRAVLIHWHDGAIHKTEAEIFSAEASEHKWILTVGSLHWNEVDRRRYPRLEVKLPVKVRAIAEREGQTGPQEFGAETEDLSLGGAWINVDAKLPIGSLVEVQMGLGEADDIRILGMTAQNLTNREGVGIEFLDYIGGARYHLHSYLTAAA